jgi:hypothetical protein
MPSTPRRSHLIHLQSEEYFIFLNVNKNARDVVLWQTAYATALSCGVNISIVLPVIGE